MHVWRSGTHRFSQVWPFDRQENDVEGSLQFAGGSDGDLQPLLGSSFAYDQAVLEYGLQLSGFYFRENDLPAGTRESPGQNGPCRSGTGYQYPHNTSLVALKVIGISFC